ncbi:MAG TPA: DUF1641 domain-containing protein [Edaphobacter sp.]|jgi:uncharacterized protein YjgD (DUF1641 family)|nr:DUF1641 domain-containing protein [Edaphobacter sp.]
MAKPVAFIPVTVDFEADLRRRLEKAPAEHAAALLAAYDVIEAAHQQGLLSILHGMIASKETILSVLAKYAAEPGSIVAIRNLLTAAKLLGELDPELLENLSKVMDNATEVHKQEIEPPSLWQLYRRATSEDSRRGLSFMTLILSGLGKSLKS